MEIKTKYDVYEWVMIEELGVRGKIMGIFYKTMVEYNVRYFDDAAVQHEYFHEDELRRIK